ncbi:DUF4253 domain-containing protein [Streptomyces sp. Tu102]|uniref:DUF4253 domain-containing protein n=1 Tax=Streptomyces TaxID=1883 RepID=UPI001BDD2C72|nr:DUF4253 domain-containing protein [Streptomyces sp. Tu102]MBT1096775.1 DUF4253 domain-containing protein [Streptomyces sp. Tu102]
MATLPNPLPKLTSDPTGAALGLQLPPGRLVDATDEGPWHEPLLWLADEKAAPGDWAALAPARRSAGLLPVVVDGGGRHGGPQDWELAPDAVSYPGDHDADEVLADLWEEYAAGETQEEWPGLADVGADPDSGAGSGSAEDPDAVAMDIADDLVASGGLLEEPRLALVPARRSADIPAAIGWSGPVNHEGDTARLCAVLRSWEDRFGIRVVALGFDHLLVSVAFPPATLAEAEAVAAEHFAFCPDNILQSGDTSIRAYAENRLLGRPAWHFWWD